jgi:hypothetical protein
MTTYRRNAGDGLAALFRGRQFNRGAAWGMMIIGALLAFEIFNFSTTQFALFDLLGDLRFAGMRWSTILAIAFCGIDFAGIARIFTPEQGRDEPVEIWYLFGAWLLAAGFNASLTWWGVSVAIVNHNSLAGGAVISNAALTKVVPVFVAIMVWLIRVLIIGTFSVAGDRLFTTDTQRSASGYRQPATQGTTQTLAQATGMRPASTINRPASTYHPAPKPAQQTTFARPEPTYHNLSFGDAAPNGERYDA